jgi:uncharacterized membrane protein YhaH (DUF805 family)
MSIPPPPPLSFPSEPPLWAPYYGAPIGVAIARFWKKYATFSGRASRSEYWWWALVNFGVALVLEIALASFGASAALASGSGAAVVPGPGYFVVIALAWVVSLGLLVPSLALVWRRLHDTNRSGGYYFMGLIPFVGPIILIVFFASASDPGGARFDQPQL